MLRKQQTEAGLCEQIGFGAAIDIDLVRALFPSWVRMFDIFKISTACGSIRKRYILDFLQFSHIGLTDACIRVYEHLLHALSATTECQQVVCPDLLPYLYTILSMLDILEYTVTVLTHPCPTIYMFVHFYN